MVIDKKIVKRLLKYPNVNGVGWGEMTKNKSPRGMGYVITVSKKVTPENLAKNDLIPRVIDDMETDVIEIGELKALGRTDASLPFLMGDSVGHKDITAGTAGFLARRPNDSNTYLVSNNHVLANVNKGKKGDEILKPGPYDGGNNVIGRLNSFVEITFPGCKISNLVVKALNFIASVIKSNSTFSYSNSSARAANLVDCAMATLINPDGDSIPTVRELGSISSVGTFAVGDVAWKSGRTTGIKNGVVAITDYTGQVNMGVDSGVATFEDQYLINTPGFSAGGDSGSSVHKKLDNGVLSLCGLLFAGSERVTIVNKIQNVLSGLNIVPIT